jgi:hypothetical protein
MQTEPLHVVDRAGEPGDLELAPVARSGVNEANREGPAEEARDAPLERPADLDGGGIARGQRLGGDPDFPDLRKQPQTSPSTCRIPR